MPRNDRARAKLRKERKPFVIALRLSERVYQDLLRAAQRRGTRRGTLAADLLAKALRRVNQTAE